MLITSLFSIQPRRAVVTPYFMVSSPRCRMSVGGYNDFHAALLCHSQVYIIQIEALRCRVAFHGHAVLRRGREHLLHVVFERLAPQNEPPGGMRDDLCVRILDRGQNSFGHLRFFHVHVRVYGRYDYVELGEHFVVQIEGAILLDVHFNAGEKTDAGTRVFWASRILLICSSVRFSSIPFATVTA